MTAIATIEGQWFADAARNVVDKHGAEKAQRIADFQRASPLPGAPRNYPDMIEAEIARRSQGRAA